MKRIGILLYQDKKCRCWFSKVLHFDLIIGDYALPYVLKAHPYTPTLYAECADSRFTFSVEGVCPPGQLNNSDEWASFCKELVPKLYQHYLNIALPLVLPKQPVFEIEFTGTDVSYMNSKLGGSFYWPNNNPPSLRFLAQVNLAELPKNDIFPKTGILQFFIGKDESYGLFDGKDGYQVVYHADISSGTEILSDTDGTCTPICKPSGMKFTLTKEYMSMYDFRFQKYLSHTNDEIYELIYDSFSGQGDKLLGYPFFTQDDPRTFLEDNKKDNTLLLQLDSDGEHINWGDNGVGNFFINDEALKNADFSDVLYNWDCY